MPPKENRYSCLNPQFAIIHFQRINQKEKLQYFADNQGAKVVKSEKIKIKSRSKNKRFIHI